MQSPVLTKLWCICTVSRVQHTALYSEHTCPQCFQPTILILVRTCTICNVSCKHFFKFKLYKTWTHISQIKQSDHNMPAECIWLHKQRVGSSSGIPLSNAMWLWLVEVLVNGFAKGSALTERRLCCDHLRHALQSTKYT